MQTINELVKNLGIPVSVAIAMVVIAYLWKYNEKRRDEQDKAVREFWSAALDGMQEHQELRDAQFTAALRDIAQELRDNRVGSAGLPRRRK